MSPAPAAAPSIADLLAELEAASRAAFSEALADARFRAVLDAPVVDQDHRRPLPVASSALDDARRVARAERIGEEWRASLLVSQPDPRRFLTIVEG